ncbi:MAG: amidophosphoribosyltransferase [Firmicutes bacterium]|nr:amidophosphoribosyltransferase [Bacillota bacterium]
MKTTKTKENKNIKNLLSKSDKPQEECAVFGVSLFEKEAVGVTYIGLIALQHRGQESAGMAVVLDGNKIFCHKNMGLVTDVFYKKKMATIPNGKVAIGHTRYSKEGSDRIENAGPFVTEFLTGRIAVTLNGCITNVEKIREFLQGFGVSFGATATTEVVSSLIALYITKEKKPITGIKKAVTMLEGAFSLVVAMCDGTLYAVRDPNGFRPLCIGFSNMGCVVASESCALDSCGFLFSRDVLPGEIVEIKNGRITSGKVELTTRCHGQGLCIFEYVYFSRPDSVIDGQSVYESRFNMGKALAKEHPAEADVVCGAPDSGLDAAAGFASESGIPLVTGFIKNRYIGRSFIYPTQAQREAAVSLKLNPLKASIAGKRVVLVDDSIVRGTTCNRVVNSLKKAGATEVHVRISSPHFKHTCHYGTDIDSEDNLIANQLDDEGICKAINAESLGFISINGLVRSCSKSNSKFCTACFTGNNCNKN